MKKKCVFGFESLKQIENVKIPLLIEQMTKLETQVVGVDTTRGRTEFDVKDL